LSWLEVQSAQAWREARAEGRVAVIVLPYPPTTNNLFAPQVRKSRKTGRTVVSKRKTEEARNYAEEVWYHVRSQRGHRGFTGPLALLMCATPPDGRRRDVFNTEKAVTDGLVAAGVMLDDSQIADGRLVWAGSAYHDESREPGVEVSVRELLPHELSAVATARTATKGRCSIVGESPTKRGRKQAQIALRGDDNKTTIQVATDTERTCTASKPQPSNA